MSLREKVLKALIQTIVKSINDELEKETINFAVLEEKTTLLKEVLVNKHVLLEG